MLSKDVKREDVMIGHNNTIVLTGATGFLGSHLLYGLIQTGSYRIVVLKRSFSDVSRIKNVLGMNGVEFIDIDASGDAVRTRFAQGDVAAVIHCATEYGRGEKRIADVLRANLIFPIKLLEMCAEFGVGAFINTDSYFNKPSLQYPYLLDYSLSKKSLLLWLPYFSQKVGIANMILEHVFGPNDGAKKFVTGMVKQIAVEKRPSIELSPGEQVRDFIYVYDVVSAYLCVLGRLLAESEPRLVEYEVGTGVGVDIRSFVGYIKDLSQSPTKLLLGALPYRRAEIMRSVANTNPLKSLGWEAKYDWASGLRDLLQHNE